MAVIYGQISALFIQANPCISIFALKHNTFNVGTYASAESSASENKTIELQPAHVAESAIAIDDACLLFGASAVFVQLFCAVATASADSIAQIKIAHTATWRQCASAMKNISHHLISRARLIIFSIKQQLKYHTRVNECAVV